MNERPHTIPCAIAALCLLGALAPWPYGYYQLLRFVVCGAAIYTAFKAYGWHKIWAVWVFGFVALLFNPFIPIHLSSEVWHPIDVVCAGLFGYAIFGLREPCDKKNMECSLEGQSK